MVLRTWEKQSIWGVPYAQGEILRLSSRSRLRFQFAKPPYCKYFMSTMCIRDFLYDYLCKNSLDVDNLCMFVFSF